MFSHSLIFTALASLAAAQKIVFDGRIPAATKLTDFDAKNKFFGESNVLGKGLKFSEALLLPKTGASIFDTKGGTVPLEVTINDKSIFNDQLGFRRIELIPSSNDGKDASTDGVKTTHFSISKDAQKPLNTSHEYQLFFLESADFSTNQIVLKTGTVLGKTTKDPDTLQMFGNVNDAGGKLLFSTPFTAGAVHNWAVKADFTANTVEVFYSTDKAPLKSVVKPTPNDFKGKGQWHFGMLKKGTNPGKDVTKEAFQPTGINEGVIFSSIFQEDSSTGNVTLS